MSSPRPLSRFPRASASAERVARGGPVAIASSVQQPRLWRARLIGRVLVIGLAAFLALMFSSSSSEVVSLGQAALIAAVWLTVGPRFRRALRPVAFGPGPIESALTAAVLGSVCVGVLEFWVPGIGIHRWSLLAVAGATAAAAALWDALLGRLTEAPRRLLVVGGGEATSRLIADLRRDRGVPFQVVAVVDDDVHQSIDETVAYGGRLDSLPAAVRRFSPDLVVVAVTRGRPQVFTQLLEVADAGFQVIGLPEIYESAFGCLPVADLTSAWFMSALHAYQRPSNHLAKRGFDLVVALTGVIVTLPLLPVIVLLVKRTKGPLLYRQCRLGENGKPFTMLKFRSMRVDAEASGEAQWAAKNDPRVIPGGRLLRLLRLDELPQLWNVLRGEMSIVGPRPERPEFVEHLKAEVPFWTQRHLLKPGITGWAQIRAGYAADALGAAEKLSYDLWYLRHRSLFLDLTICFRTLPRMAFFRGAR